MLKSWSLPRRDEALDRRVLATHTETAARRSRMPNRTGDGVVWKKEWCLLFSSLLFSSLLFSLRDCFRASAVLQTEILGLRHQLLVLQCSSRRHRLPLRWANRILSNGARGISRSQAQSGLRISKQGHRCCPYCPQKKAKVAVENAA